MESESNNSGPTADHHIRRIVREELSSVSRQGRERGAAAVTHNLLQSAARSVRAAQSTSPAPASTPAAENDRPNASDIWGPHSGGRSSFFRRGPTHSNRVNQKSRRKPYTGPPSRPKAVTVVVLNQDLDGRDSYRPDKDDELLTGQCELRPEHSEEGFRELIAEMIQQKFPLVGKDSFEFLRRDKNVVCAPVVATGHVWNYMHLRALMGQGKLYCRLNVPASSLLTKASQKSPTSGQEHCEDSSDTEECSIVEVQTAPSNSQGRVVVASRSFDPTNLFKDDQASEDEELELPQASFNSLVNEILDNQTVATCTPEAPNTGPMSLEEACCMIRSNFQEDNEKLKIDREDALMDCLSFFKRPTNEAPRPLQIVIRGEPAIDSGGVLRQFFTDVFDQMVSGACGIPPLFEGRERSLLPVCNSDVIVTGMMSMIGRIFVHAVAQAEVGPAFLAPSVYSYICTGEIEGAVADVSVSDTTEPYRKVIEQILHASSAETFSEIVKQEDYQDVAAAAGVRSCLNGETAETIIQSLIIHDILVRRKAALDQLREGMKFLGMLPLLSAKPELFSDMFVSGGLTSSKVLSKIHVAQNDPNDTRAFSMVEHFLQNADEGTLELFLLYTTGSKSLPIRKLSVQAHASNAIFSSTCSFELKVPVAFEDAATFTLNMNAVLRECKKSFTAC